VRDARAGGHFRRIGGRADRAEGDRRQLDRALPFGGGVRRQVPGNYHVCAFGADLARRCHREPDTDIGPQPIEIDQFGYQPAHREGRATGHVQRGPARLIEQTTVTLFELVQRRAYHLIERLAVLVQAQTGPLALE